VSFKLKLQKREEGTTLFHYYPSEIMAQVSDSKNINKLNDIKLCYFYILIRIAQLGPSPDLNL